MKTKLLIFFIALLTTGFALAHEETTQKVLDHHLQSFGGGDLVAILSDYTENSTIVLPNGVLKGKTQIEGLFKALIAEFSKPGLDFSLDHTVVTGDLAYIIWHAETADNNYNFATDTFVVNNGKILYQTIAFDATAK